VRRFLAGLHHVPIWLRVVVSVWLIILVAWSATVIWASRVQRETAIEQALDFAASVHQLTLAGLTGMMITGTIDQRAVFLDQIRQSSNIRGLRVVRGDAVTAQFGPGKASEIPSDPLELRAIRSGQPMHETRDTGSDEIVKVAMPAVAQSEYLGKNCLQCHLVPEGTVLGAVTMEIALEKVSHEIRHFAERISLAAIGFSIPLLFLVYVSVSRLVTGPLRRMGDGLNRIAEGEIDFNLRLDVKGADEVAAASAAFNRVMERVDQLLTSERLAAEVFGHSIEAIVICDGSGTIRKVNEAFTRTTGYTEAEVVGRNPRILQSGRHDRDFYRAFWQALIQNGEWQGEIWNRRKDGEIYAEWLKISAVRSQTGETQYFIGLFSDITERKRQEELIQYQAFHDALTGLPNRTLFRDRLAQAIAAAHRHHGQLVGLMFLDLDRFKEINDNLGHQVGDEVLQETARRLRGCVRGVDTVARMGGDEFTVLLPEVSDVSSTEIVATKIMVAMRKPFRIAGRELAVTTSIGISLHPQHGTDVPSLMAHADMAMYHVKARGRAGYAVFDPAKMEGKR